MQVEQIRTGGDRNFAYIIADESAGVAAVIDPSYWPAKVAEVAERNGWKVVYVLNTHHHHDHTNGNEEFERLTGCKGVGYGDVEPSSGNRIENDMQLPLGNLTLRILHTPGHTEDSICILVGDALFTGDTLFVGKVGGTDFGQEAKTQYASLHERLMTLPEETRVFPGHDVGAHPVSTIGEEKRSNPFLLQPDFDSFLHLKKTWLEYKRQHGIN